MNADKKRFMFTNGLLKSMFSNIFRFTARFFDVDNPIIDEPYKATSYEVAKFLIVWKKAKNEWAKKHDKTIWTQDQYRDYEHGLFTFLTMIDNDWIYKDLIKHIADEWDRTSTKNVQQIIDEAIKNE